MVNIKGTPVGIYQFLLLRIAICTLCGAFSVLSDSSLRAPTSFTQGAACSIQPQQLLQVRLQLAQPWTAVALELLQVLWGCLVAATSTCKTIPTCCLERKLCSIRLCYFLAKKQVLKEELTLCRTHLSFTEPS